MGAATNRMMSRSHLGFIAVLLAGMGCAEGRDSGPPPEDTGTDPSTRDADKDPWAEDEHGGRTPTTSVQRTSRFPRETPDRRAPIPP